MTIPITLMNKLLIVVERPKVRNLTAISWREHLYCDWMMTSALYYTLLDVYSATL